MGLLTERQKMLALACAVIFIDMIGYGIVIPILPIYAKELGASEGQIGFLFASYSLVLLLTLLPFGLMVDRYGKKHLIVSGMFLLGISSILFATSHSLPQLTVSRMLQGLSASCTWAAALPLAAAAASEGKRGIEMSSVTISTGIGTILGPVVGGLGSIHTPFYACIAFSSLLFFLSLIYLKKTPFKKEYSNLKEKLKRVLMQGEVQAACIAISFLYFALGMLETLFPLYMTSCQCRRITVGLLFGIFGIFFVVVQPIIGAWSDRMGRTFPMVLGLSMTAVVIPVPFRFVTIVPWVLLFMIMGISSAMVFTPTYPLIADGVKPSDQGVAYGLNSWVFSLGYLLGPWLGGALTESAGIKTPFLLCSAVLATGAFGIWAVGKWIIKTHP
ncbi:MAG: MFS transporter [Thermodesulfobacteriota bacterium]|nr:MFS transporter [Thermodesulfobacteriota bacterium]